VIAFRKPYIAEVLIRRTVYQLLGCVIANKKSKITDDPMNFSLNLAAFFEKQGLLRP
jgi:hypothetical protein|tara:strand:+ start:7214 stop:7384 length:171 start_codon:yes stop_codon:yes gene_type:complete